MIHRSVYDATIINTTSNQFFTLLNDICCEVGLTAKVPIIPSNSFKAKQPMLYQEN